MPGGDVAGALLAGLLLVLPHWGVGGMLMVSRNLTNLVSEVADVCTPQSPTLCRCLCELKYHPESQHQCMLAFSSTTRSSL